MAALRSNLRRDVADMGSLLMPHSTSRRLRCSREFHLARQWDWDWPAAPDERVDSPESVARDNSATERTARLRRISSSTPGFAEVARSRAAQAYRSACRIAGGCKS